jgi:hypothetical protein
MRIQDAQERREETRAAKTKLRPPIKNPGGRAPRQKGNRREREAVKTFQGEGVGAERIPLSGSAGGKFSGDLSVPCLGRDLRVEVKARAVDCKRIRKWLGANDGVILHVDREEALLIVRLRLGAKILAAAERGKS